MQTCFYSVESHVTSRDGGVLDFSTIAQVERYFPDMVLYKGFSGRLVGLFYTFPSLRSSSPSPVWHPILYPLMDSTKTFKGTKGRKKGHFSSETILLLLLDHKSTLSVKIIYSLSNWAYVFVASTLIPQWEEALLTFYSHGRFWGGVGEFCLKKKEL